MTMRYDAYDERRKIADLTATKILGGLSYAQGKTLQRRIHNLAAATGETWSFIARQARRDAQYLIHTELA